MSLFHLSLAQGREITGRVVKDIFRYGALRAAAFSYNSSHSTHGNIVLGKYFYIQLEGAGKLPLLHFGMTGMLHVRLSYMLRSGLIILFQGERPAHPSVQDEDP
jgi:hypothetical protein